MIHVSPTTKALLDTFGTFKLECRGEVAMKVRNFFITPMGIIEVNLQSGIAMDYIILGGDWTLHKQIFIPNNFISFCGICIKLSN